MFLDYDTYVNMGGTLEQTAFQLYNRRAESLIRAQAAGQTGKRIDKMGEVPEAVKACAFDLITLLSAHPTGEKQVTAESQSLGGQSESVSYAATDAAGVAAECDDLIFNAFYGAGLGELLYRGLHYAE